MENNNFYEEFNNIEEVQFNNIEETNYSIDNEEVKSISFVSKARSFFNKHVGVKLSKIGFFFKGLKNKFVEKFVEKEKPEVREPIVDTTKFEYKDENKEMFDKNVKLAHEIDKLIKDNNEVDLTDELAKLKVIVKELASIDRENDYKALTEVFKKLRKLRREVKEKINNADKSLGGFIPANTVTEEKTDKVDDKTNGVKPVTKADDKTNDVKPVTKTDDKTSVSGDLDDYSKAVAKEALIDSKIASLKEKIDFLKFNVINYETKKVDEVDTIINNAEFFASKLHLPANRRPKAVKEMGNEFNLDTKEINAFKEEKAYRISKIDESEAKIDKLQQEIEKLEIEKEQNNNEYITVKVPNEYAKDGFLVMRMTKEAYERKMKKMQLLEERITLMAEKKAKEERIAKLKAELANLEGNVAETEEKLSSNSNKLKTTNTISEYDRDMIASFHKSL